MRAVAVIAEGAGIDPPDNEVDLRLGRMENRMLWCLRNHPGRVVGYEALARAMWGGEADESRRDCLKVHAHRIRQKTGLQVHVKVHLGYWLAAQP